MASHSSKVFVTALALALHLGAAPSSATASQLEGRDDSCRNAPLSDHDRLIRQLVLAKEAADRTPDPKVITIRLSGRDPSSQKQKTEGRYEVKLLPPRVPTAEEFAQARKARARARAKKLAIQRAKAAARAEARIAELRFKEQDLQRQVAYTASQMEMYQINSVAKEAERLLPSERKQIHLDALAQKHHLQQLQASLAAVQGQIVEAENPAEAQLAAIVARVQTQVIRTMIDPAKP